MRKFLCLLLALCCIPAFGDTLILNDGTTHQGTLISATSNWITFQENNTNRRYLRSSIQSIEFGDGAAAANGTYNNNPAYGNNYPNDTTNGNNATWGNRNSNVALPANATLPAGTQISVITNGNIDSSTANEGQTFPADVAQNVTDPDGRVIIPKGAQAMLVLRQVQEAGTTGSPEIALGLDSVNFNGRRYIVSSEDVTQSAEKAGIGKNKRTAEMIGGGAVLGTLIGAIAGGGKGAAIGAVTGGAAGAGVQVLTRGKTVKVPAETTLNFQLDQPLDLQQAR